MRIRRRVSRTQLGTRARVEPAKSMRSAVRIAERYHAPVAVERPRTRAECEAAPRPCLWVACRHHLYLDINPQTGSIKINFPDLEPWELQHTCVLDVASDRPRSLEEVGAILNLTRERVRQLEVRALERLARGAIAEVAP